MATHSSVLAWRIPGTGELGGLQSMGSLRVRHDWATSLSLFTVMHWRRKWQPTPVFLPGESQGWGSLVGGHMESHRVGHDWSDLAAAAEAVNMYCAGMLFSLKISCLEMKSAIIWRFWKHNEWWENLLWIIWSLEIKRVFDFRNFSFVPSFFPATWEMKTRHAYVSSWK